MVNRTVQPGAIYLRCDMGNPGQIYKSIEFISKPVTEVVGLVAMEEGCTLDSLCFMYVAGTAVSMTEHNGLTVQNCEFGYCGNRIEQFVEPEGGEPGIWTDGNVVQIIGSKCVIKNNYFHDNEGGAVSFELGGDITNRIPFTGTVISGNIMDKCGDAIYIRNNGEDTGSRTVYGDLKITDNYIMNTGYGWYQSAASYINPSVYNGHSRNAFNFYGKTSKSGKAAVVKNNVFYRSTHALLYLTPSTDIPAFSGNTFAQDYGKPVIDAYSTSVMATTNSETKSGVKDFHKNAGEVYVLKPLEWMGLH